MRKLGIIFAVLAALVLLTPGVLAQNHKDETKHESGQPVAKEKGKSHADHGATKHKDKDKDRDEAWEERDGFEVRTYGNGDDRPPGWSRGKKTGWGNCGVPPGQAKKGACRTYSYQGRRYYYYQEDQGRMVVRRPTIKGENP